MVEWFFRSDYTAAPVSVPETVLGLLLAFVCGQVIAWVYIMTHSGLSYSRTFVNSLVLIPVIVSLVMMVLSNNIVTAFGLMAVFAIVRFRNILRDTLDTSYILGVIVLGMGCGTFRYATATMGCAIMALVLIYLWYTGFGTRHRYDYILNFHWDRPLSEASLVESLLKRHSRKTICASQRTREAGTGTDFSYRLLLRDPKRVEDLLSDVQSTAGVSRVSGMRAEEESEI